MGGCFTVVLGTELAHLQVTLSLEEGLEKGSASGSVPLYSPEAPEKARGTEATLGRLLTFQEPQFPHL